MNAKELRDKVNLLRSKIEKNRHELESKEIKPAQEMIDLTNSTIALCEMHIDGLKKNLDKETKDKSVTVAREIQSILQPEINKFLKKTEERYLNCFLKLDYAEKALDAILASRASTPIQKAEDKSETLRKELSILMEKANRGEITPEESFTKMSDIFKKLAETFKGFENDERRSPAELLVASSMQKMMMGFSEMATQSLSDFASSSASPVPVSVPSIEKKEAPKP